MGNGRQITELQVSEATRTRLKMETVSTRDHSSATKITNESLRTIIKSCKHSRNMGLCLLVWMGKVSITTTPGSFQTRTAPNTRPTQSPSLALEMTMTTTTMTRSRISKSETLGEKTGESMGIFVYS